MGTIEIIGKKLVEALYFNPMELGRRVSDGKVSFCLPGKYAALAVRTGRYNVEV